MKTLLFLAATWLLPAAHAAEAKALAVNFAQSHIHVVVKATFDTFTADLTRFEPKVTYDAATGQVREAVVRFHLRDLLTGKRSRDREMHEWQETERFPDAQFQLLALTPHEGGPAEARGVLELHGLNHAVTFPVSITHSESELAIDGEAVIDVRDHGLKPIRKLGLLRVAPAVTVQFHLQGRLEPAVAGGVE